jgi:hypothetical protein
MQPTRDALRMRQLEAELARERQLRLQAQQRAAGLASSVTRLQATVAQQRADAAARKAGGRGR